MISFATVRQKVLSALFAMCAAAGIGLSGQANAQSLEQPPALTSMDDNGVNLATGKLLLPDLDVSNAGIGRKGQAFLTGGTNPVTSVDNFTGTYVIQYENAAAGSPYPAGPVWLYASYAGKVYRFLMANGYFNHPDYPLTYSAYPYEEIGSASPAKFDCPGYTGAQVKDFQAVCKLILADTTTVTYGGAPFGNKGIMTKITKPDGEVTDISYHYDANGAPRAINTVNSSLGWALKYSVNSAYLVTSVAAVNTSLAQCVASSCTPPSDAPVATLTVSGQTRTIARNGTNVVSYTINGDVVTIAAPGGPTKTVTLHPTGHAYAGNVWKVNIGTSQWTYNYGYDTTQTSPYPFVTTVLAPNGTTRKHATDGKRKILAVTDEAGRKTTYVYDGYERLAKVVNPDGNETTGGFTAYKYGTRGNLEKTFIVPKNGISGGVYETSTNVMVTTATYAVSCDLPTATDGNYKYCNKPLTITDTNGIKQTFDYDSNSGQVSGVRMPIVNGVEADTRYTYQQQTPNAYYPNNTLLAQPPVWRLTKTTACMSSNRTGGACAAGATDERKTTIAYTGNNRLPTTTTVSRGDDSLPQTTTTTYDAHGQVIVSDGPMTGAVDEVYSFFDAMGRLVGSVGIDPDGATGTRKRQVTRISYDTAGRAWKTESGTVGTSTYSGSTPSARQGQAYTDWQSLSVQVSHTEEFQASTGLPIISRSYVGAATGTPKDVAQRSYDSMLRLDCEAIRLKSADFANVQNLNACSLGSASGSETKDRITKYAYHPVVGVLLSTTSGYGTIKARVDALKTFDFGSTTSTGNLQWVEDAKGNRTSYFYDNFNRPIKTCYPLAGSLNASSTTDCEQTSFRTTPVTGTGSVGSLVNTVTLRDNQVISLGYDTRGRVSTKAGAVMQSSTYDNFGQVVELQDNTAGHALSGTTQARQSYTYNSLGWQLTSTVNIVTAADSSSAADRTVTYQYDDYGRRSQMIYPDGFYVTYGYSDANEIVRICENGTNCAAGNTSLLNFAYDDYRRRTSTTARKADGTALTLGSLAYDSSLRLQTVAAPGNTVTLSYNAADQINSRSNSVSAFDPPPPSAGTTSYGNNGLNQMTSAGSSTLGYDTRGNMTSDGAITYTYNANNQLIMTSANATLRYDAVGRLRLVTSNTTMRQFIYDGVQLIAEYDSGGALVRRYVHGAGTDEPLVWYEKNGASFDKRYYSTDERGSIIVVTSDTGASLAQYSYDAYGVPTTVSGTIDSRFRYTGQVWLADLSLYYYKARMYAPTIGRFMQTDPIGYGDGMNWYAYVGNDPMNKTDPTGLCDEPTWGCPGQGNYLGNQTDTYQVTLTYRDEPNTEYSFFTTDQRYADFLGDFDFIGISGWEAGVVPTSSSSTDYRFGEYVRGGFVGVSIWQNTSGLTIMANFEGDKAGKLWGQWVTTPQKDGHDGCPQDYYCKGKYRNFSDIPSGGNNKRWSFDATLTLYSYGQDIFNLRYGFQYDRTDPSRPTFTWYPQGGRVSSGRRGGSTW